MSGLEFRTIKLRILTENTNTRLKKSIEDTRKSLSLEIKETKSSQTEKSCNLYAISNGCHDIKDGRSIAANQQYRILKIMENNEAEIQKETKAKITMQDIENSVTY